MSAEPAQVVDLGPIRQRPVVVKIGEESEMLATRTAGYAIVDAHGFAQAAVDLRTIKTLAEQVETERFAITRPMDAAKAAVLLFFKPFGDRLLAADSAVRKEMARYKAEQDRAAREAQRLADEAAARERAELERKAREAQRAAAEKAEAARKEAAAAEAAGRAAEAQRLREQAAATEQKAEQKAEALQQRALDVVAAPVGLAAAPAKAKGVGDRKVWRYEIVNPAMVPREYLMVDETRVGQVVRAMKGDTKIQGVRVWSEDDFTVRKGQA